MMIHEALLKLIEGAFHSYVLTEMLNKIIQQSFTCFQLKTCEFRDLDETETQTSGKAFWANVEESDSNSNNNNIFEEPEAILNFRSRIARWFHTKHHDHEEKEE